jgi:hypothetical protein
MGICINSKGSDRVGESNSDFIVLIFDLFVCWSSVIYKQCIFETYFNAMICWYF